MTATLPPCYPARPVNGGPLPKALPKAGEWCYEPKYNGWRALVHVPTGTMFNRKLERLSIAREFDGALRILRDTHADNGCDHRPIPFPEWVDCEALERRHNIGRGTLIVLDLPTVQAPLAKRHYYAQCFFDPMNQPGFEPCGSDEVRTTFTYLWSESHPEAYQLETWRRLQAENQRLGCEFYEGVVAKRNDSRYPHQRRSADVEFPFWMKHRWAF